jgi:hypothetical protein
MSASELDDVTALLERVLPDPTGFAERLVQQVVIRWAGGDPMSAGPVIVQGEAETLDADNDRSAADTTLVLAAALGACDCWGMAADCPLCAGAGTSGWTEPDVELFREFVGPALARISAEHAEQKASDSPRAASVDTPNDPTDGDPA